MSKITIINISEIGKLFREYCGENKFEFSEQKLNARADKKGRGWGKEPGLRSLAP